MEESCLC